MGQVTANLVDLQVIEPRDDLMHNPSVFAMNGVVDIDPGISFWVQVTNFGGKNIGCRRA